MPNKALFEPLVQTSESSSDDYLDPQPEPELKQVAGYPNNEVLVSLPFSGKTYFLSIGCVEEGQGFLGLLNGVAEVLNVVLDEIQVDNIREILQKPFKSTVEDSRSFCGNIYYAQNYNFVIQLVGDNTYINGSIEEKVADVVANFKRAIKDAAWQVACQNKFGHWAVDILEYLLYSKLFPCGVIGNHEFGATGGKKGSAEQARNFYEDLNKQFEELCDDYDRKKIEWKEDNVDPEARVDRPEIDDQHFLNLKSENKKPFAFAPFIVFFEGSLSNSYPYPVRLVLDTNNLFNLNEFVEKHTQAPERLHRLQSIHGHENQGSLMKNALDQYMYDGEGEKNYQENRKALEEADVVLPSSLLHLWLVNSAQLNGRKAEILERAYPKKTLGSHSRAVRAILGKLPEAVKENADNPIVTGGAHTHEATIRRDGQGRVISIVAGAAVANVSGVADRLMVIERWDNSASKMEHHITMTLKQLFPSSVEDMLRFKIKEGGAVECKNPRKIDSLFEKYPGFWGELGLIIKFFKKYLSEKERQLKDASANSRYFIEKKIQKKAVAVDSVRRICAFLELISESQGGRLEMLEGRQVNFIRSLEGRFNRMCLFLFWRSKIFSNMRIYIPRTFLMLEDSTLKWRTIFHMLVFYRYSFGGGARELLKSTVMMAFKCLTLLVFSVLDVILNACGVFLSEQASEVNAQDFELLVLAKLVRVSRELRQMEGGVSNPKVEATLSEQFSAFCLTSYENEKKSLQSNTVYLLFFLQSSYLVLHGRPNRAVDLSEGKDLFLFVSINVVSVLMFAAKCCHKLERVRALFSFGVKQAFLFFNIWRSFNRLENNHFLPDMINQNDGKSYGLFLLSVFLFFQIVNLYITIKNAKSVHEDGRFQFKNALIFLKGLLLDARLASVFLISLVYADEIVNYYFLSAFRLNKGLFSNSTSFVFLISFVYLFSCFYQGSSFSMHVLAKSSRFPGRRILGLVVALSSMVSGCFQESAMYSVLSLIVMGIYADLLSGVLLPEKYGNYSKSLYSQHSNGTQFESKLGVPGYGFYEDMQKKYGWFNVVEFSFVVMVFLYCKPHFRQKNTEVRMTAYLDVLRKHGFIGNRVVVSKELFEKAGGAAASFSVRNDEYGSTDTAIEAPKTDKPSEEKKGGQLFPLVPSGNYHEAVNFHGAATVGF